MAASSRMSSSSSGVVSAAASNRSRSKSRPMTAASDRLAADARPRRTTRASITSRTPAGSPTSPTPSGATQRPSSSRRSAPDLEEMAEDLVDEERVAVGLAVDGVGQGHPLVVHGLAGDGLHDRHHLAGLEPRQFDALHPARPPQGAQGLDQGVGGGQLAVTERAQHDQAHRAVGRHQVSEELQAAHVGPLQVVEDDDHGVVLGDPGHELDHRGEQLVALGVRIDGPDRRDVGHPARPATEAGRPVRRRSRPPGRPARRRGRTGRSARVSRRTAGRDW